MAKIAVVDDSEVALDWAQQALSPHGHEVVTYSKSSGITGFVRARKPDLLLLDVQMDVKGDVICKVLKEDITLKSVVIALYSSMPEGELKSLAESVGADGHICKTDDPESLATQVQKYLNN